MNDEAKSMWSNIFRGFVGVTAILGSLLALGGLYFVDVPSSNKEPLLLALGLILGWGTSVVNSEYGASSTARKVVEQAVKNIDRQQSADVDTKAQIAQVPTNAVDAAQDTATAAQDKADIIKGDAK